MKKWLKRGLLTFIAIPTAIIIVIVALYIIFPILNDIKAGNLATKWASSIVLPSDTEIVEVISGCGNSGGTGNHTEVWAGILINSDLSQDEIKDYFGADIFIVDEKNTQTYIMRLLGKKFVNLDKITEYDGYYIIESVENAVSSEFDLRGH